MFGFLLKVIWNSIIELLFSRFFEIGIKFQIQKFISYDQPQNFIWGSKYTNHETYDIPSAKNTGFFFKYSSIKVKANIHDLIT